ncbi:hypothetical protein F5Y18DRAFT_402526 [Xylariaceae sp. FL1019]|nr:hypothetical protein F5Y18DRAFT_402526 [Xylariaceae sp. FL1019]
MSEAGPSRSPPVAGAALTSPKRRKIRKGTQSCWECKRRKTRCTFARPTATVCDGCRSRRIKCISQEFDDEVMTRPSGEGNWTNAMKSPDEQLNKRYGVDLPHRLSQGPSDQNEPAEARDSSLSVPATISNNSHLDSHETDSLGDISRALRAMWPNQHDLDIILSVPVGVSVLLHGVWCMPYSTFLSEHLTSPRRMLQLPPGGSHPVLVARRLLMLVTFLQAISPSLASKLAGMSSDYRVLMSRVVKTVARLVTSNDELVESIEGIECVMIESMYLNNAGNLRRAWLVNRRAMVMAQMIGLHTGMPALSKALEADTRDRINPEYMWFRIVSSDRYLSLILGLPQGTLEDVFASPSALAGCMSMERMERVMTVAGGLILQRNGAERTDMQAAYKVDKLLQEAAAMMPPQWWSITPDLTAVANNGAEEFQETVRLMNQFAYHHLLVQLHLPYILQPPSTIWSYDYSKMTAATASRAIVTLFISFRTSVLATAYCRGIDFIAFIASTTLCLTHIEARRQLFNGLQHQRLSDRGLLERTLEMMETRAQQNGDAIAREVSSVLKPLLVVEDNSAMGGSYHASASSEANRQGSRCLSITGNAYDVLCIKIPYFGTIKIEHRPALYIAPSLTQAPFGERSQSASTAQPTDENLVTLCEPTSSLNQEQTQEHAGGIASTLRPAGYEISTAEPVNTDWRAVPSYFDALYPHQQSLAANPSPSSRPLGTGGGEGAQLLVPGLEADISDWALQGADMALFSSLTQGATGPTETTSRTDMQ